MMEDNLIWRQDAGRQIWRTGKYLIANKSTTAQRVFLLTFNRNVVGSQASLAKAKKLAMQHRRELQAAADQWTGPELPERPIELPFTQEIEEHCRALRQLAEELSQ